MQKNSPSRSGIFQSARIGRSASLRSRISNRRRKTAGLRRSGKGIFQRTLTFAERVAYQRIVEDVYWRHLDLAKKILIPNRYLMRSCLRRSWSALVDIPVEVTGAGGLLATADYFRAVTGRNRSHGKITQKNLKS